MRASTFCLVSLLIAAAACGDSSTPDSQGLPDAQLPADGGDAGPDSSADAWVDAGPEGPCAKGCGEGYLCNEEKNVCTQCIGEEVPCADGLLCDYDSASGIGACVECLMDGDCKGSEKPLCDDDTKSCTEPEVLCEETCEGERPRCDPETLQCVACTKDLHCTDPALPFCQERQCVAAECAEACDAGSDLRCVATDDCGCLTSADCIADLVCLAAERRCVEPTSEEYPAWTEPTHAKHDPTDEDYATVFPSDRVLRIDLRVAASDWAAMEAQLAQVANGSFTGGPGGGGRGPGGSGGGGTGSGCNINAGISLDEVDYIPASVVMGEREWYRVGLRFKGNKSLQSPYREGKKKFSLKLKFDEFEDLYPALKGQRFYGFKKLNLANNYGDKSLMRERVAADLFREFGIPAARTAFAEVYVDTGSGTPIYFGLYTLIEDIDDSALKKQLGEKKGNLYKPEGSAASFANNLYDEDHFVKKSNEENLDFSDVWKLYETLNSGTRTSDNAAWREELEKILDVDQFLRWLAANTVLQNWDTYGSMAHNYYLYRMSSKAEKSANRFIWIPWDNNEALQNQSQALSLGMSEVTSCWPLIRYLLDVPAYKSVYANYVKAFQSEVFAPTETTSRYARLAALIRDSVSREAHPYTYLSNGTSSSAQLSAFDSAVSALKTHAQSRATAVSAFSP